MRVAAGSEGFNGEAKAALAQLCRKALQLGDVARGYRLRYLKAQALSFRATRVNMTVEPVEKGCVIDALFRQPHE